MTQSESGDTERKDHKAVKRKGFYLKEEIPPSAYLPGCNQGYRAALEFNLSA